jgi:hypothetical protein
MISVQRRKVRLCVLFRRSLTSCGKSVSERRSEKFCELERTKMSFASCATAVRGLRKSVSNDGEK